MKFALILVALTFTQSLCDADDSDRNRIAILEEKLSRQIAKNVDEQSEKNRIIQHQLQKIEFQDRKIAEKTKEIAEKVSEILQLSQEILEIKEKLRRNDSNVIEFLTVGE
jgi:2C-methyl-D-erythritol 2,4-cyclodiphosphate synthase